jgi:hypothetical protein
LMRKVAFAIRPGGTVVFEHAAAPGLNRAPVASFVRARHAELFPRFQQFIKWNRRQAALDGRGHIAGIEERQRERYRHGVERRDARSDPRVIDRDDVQRDGCGHNRLRCHRLAKAGRSRRPASLIDDGSSASVLPIPIPRIGTSGSDWKAFATSPAAWVIQEPACSQNPSPSMLVRFPGLFLA